MLDGSVEQSRAKRLERQKSRFRDRGGIYVPPARNVLKDILLARTITGESPVKKRRASKGISDPGSLVSDKGKSKGTTKSTSSRASTKKDESSRRQSTTSDMDYKSQTRGRTQDGQGASALPVAGPSNPASGTDIPSRVSKMTDSHTGASKSTQTTTAPKRRGRPPKSRPDQADEINEGPEDQPVSKQLKSKPKSKAKATAASAKKRPLANRSDDEDSGSDFEPQAPLKKRPKSSGTTKKVPPSRSEKLSRAKTAKVSADNDKEVLEKAGATSGTSHRGKAKASKSSSEAVRSGKGKHSFLGVSDDEDDEDEEWMDVPSVPVPAKKTSQKAKSVTTQNESDAAKESKGSKTGSHRKSKPGDKNGTQKQSERQIQEKNAMDGETLLESGPNLGSSNIHPPRPKSHFQNGCNLPVIEEEDEEEEISEKSKGTLSMASLATIARKLTESRSVVNQKELNLKSLEERTVKPKEKSSQADTKKRQREADVFLDESFENERALPLAGPARKRAKVASEKATGASKEAVPANTIEPVSKTTVNKTSRKKGSSTGTGVQKKARKEKNAVESTKATSIMTDDVDSVKIPKLYTSGLKENVNVAPPTITKSTKGKKAVTTARPRKGPPRSVLDRIKAAPPPPADSDDDPLDFLS